MNIRIASMAGALALAVSTPANATTCYDQTVAAMHALWAKGASPMSPDLVKDGINKAGTDHIVASVSSKVEQACRPFVADNAKAYAGLSQPAEPAPAPQAAAKPAAVTSDRGPGAEIDRQIAELQQLAATGGVTKAEIKAIEAKIAELSETARRDRDAAAAELLRLRRADNRDDRNTAALAEATKKLQAANASFEASTKLQEGLSKRLDDVEKLANDNRDRLNTILTEDGEKGRLVELERKLSSQSGSAWSYWDWAVALLALLSASGVGFLWWSKASKKNVAEAIDGVHGRIDRVTDDVQLDPNSEELLKTVKLGGEAAVVVLVSGVPTYHGLTFVKIDDDHFATAMPVGTTPAGQDIGNPLSFIRRAHTRRQNDLEPFRLNWDVVDGE